MNWLRILFEAIIVGLVVVLLGYIVGAGTSLFIQQRTPIACRNWNKNHIMEINLFLIGFFFHLITEVTGINSRYCLYRAKDIIKNTK